MLGFHPLGDVALGEITIGNPVVISEVGAFVLTGQDALWQRTGVADAGAFTLTGQATLFSLSMSAGTGAFTLAGQDAGLHKGFVLQAEPTVNTFAEHPLFSPLGALAFGESKANDQATTFVLTGANADGAKSIGFAVDAGAFVWTGQDATLTFQGYPNKIRVFPSVALPLRGGRRGGGPVGRVHIGTNPRARAFGG